MESTSPVMEVISRATQIFALTLAAALLIERLFEIVKSAIDMLDSRYDWHRFWTRRTESTQRFVERRLRVFTYVEPQQATAFLARFQEMLLGPSNGYTGTVPMLSGDLVRAAWVRMAAKLVGMTIGIGLAFWFQIDLFYLARGCPQSGGSCEHTAWQIILSGMAIGLGAGPVHKLIRRLEQKREKRLAQAGANAS